MARTGRSTSQHKQATGTEKTKPKKRPQKDKERESEGTNGLGGRARERERETHPLQMVTNRTRDGAEILHGSITPIRAPAFEKRSRIIHSLKSSS